MGAQPLQIRTALSASDLRRMARSEDNRRASMRMLAIANAIDGFGRCEAARLVGMSGQALCDAINRFNSEGLAGLQDRTKSGRPSMLDTAQRQELRDIAIAGPDIEREGLSSYTRDDFVRIARERWKVSYHAVAMGRILRKLGLSRQKTRPSHPKKDPAVMRDACVLHGEAMLRMCGL